MTSPITSSSRIRSPLPEDSDETNATGVASAPSAKTAQHSEMAPYPGRSAFVQRGIAAIARSEMAGDWVPAELVIARIEAKLAAARDSRKKKSVLPDALRTCLSPQSVVKSLP